MDQRPAPHATDVASRRRAAARTAWVIAGIAVTVYVAFILSGVLAS